MTMNGNQSLGEASPELPLGGLLALATAAFITLLTEIMPAGMLSSIASGLGVSESLAGQFITAYAIGALVAAIPLTTLTRGLRRRPLLLVAILGFAAVNLVTALSDNYTISIIARFAAGIFGGIVWSLLAGYAVRMSPSHLSGRAIAISGAGATIALVIGVPLGALLGRWIGWQGAFGLMTALALGLSLWILLVVPDFPGQEREKRESLKAVATKSGIPQVLLVVLLVVVAHNILYIYIEPFAALSGLSQYVDAVLFTFGVGAIVGLTFVGAMVDRALPSLALGSVALFLTATGFLGLFGDSAPVVFALVFVWGLGFGGFATLTQTALARFAGPSVDIAQAMYTTGWNTAVALGGIAGGVILERTGAASFPPVIMVLLVISLLLIGTGMNRRLALAG